MLEVGGNLDLSQCNVAENGASRPRTTIVVVDVVTKSAGAYDLLMAATNAESTAIAAWKATVAANNIRNEAGQTLRECTPGPVLAAQGERIAPAGNVTNVTEVNLGLMTLQASVAIQGAVTTAVTTALATGVALGVGAAVAGAVAGAVGGAVGGATGGAAGGAGGGGAAGGGGGAAAGVFPLIMGAQRFGLSEGVDAQKSPMQTGVAGSLGWADPVRCEVLAFLVAIRVVDALAWTLFYEPSYMCPSMGARDV